MEGRNGKRGRMTGDQGRARERGASGGRRRQSNAAAAMQEEESHRRAHGDQGMEEAIYDRSRPE